MAGLILAGGASRRYGRDKSLAEVDGRPMAVSVWDALVGSGVTPVLVVGGDGPALEALGLAWIPDRWPGEGPLGGLITGLGAVSEPWALGLACDLPHLRPEALSPVVATCGHTRADVVVPICSGRRQPLAAGYRRRSLSHLADRWEAGERSLQGALTGLVVQEIEVPPEWVPAFTDHDTPEAGGALA